jgi:hypothetical protein
VHDADGSVGLPMHKFLGLIGFQLPASRSSLFVPHSSPPLNIFLIQFLGLIGSHLLASLFRVNCLVLYFRVRVGTNMEDAQINELGSTSSNLEGQAQVDQNPKTSKTKRPPKHSDTFDVSNQKSDNFQAILQLLFLVNSLDKVINHQPHRNNIPDLSGTRKAFGFVDAITNLMVRDTEIVAAVAIGDPIPTTGIISVNSPCENVQVGPQYTSYF